MLLAGNALPSPGLEIDLAEVGTDTGELLRIHGETGNGAFGVPVAAGNDCDGDGAADFAMAAILASPLGRERAGLVYLVFGSGEIAGAIDTGSSQAGVLKIAGASRQEHAGNEIWLDDVTGDGRCDLLIGRQNFTPSAGLEGAGALSIIPGGPGMRAVAQQLATVDLRTPPAALSITTISGTQRGGRLGIWVRSGDVTGDGIADVIVAADQEDHVGRTHSGSVYVIRGGNHLTGPRDVSLDSVASSPLAGHVARIDAPPMSSHYHFGATCAAGDLDGNGRAEVLIAAALNRAGASLPAAPPSPPPADGIGGPARGATYIVWDDNFPATPWPDGFALGFDSLPGSRSVLRGGVGNNKFGEELLGGDDYDGDGRPELFVGDLTADLSPSSNRRDSGAGYVFYDAERLKNVELTLDSVPGEIRYSTFAGISRDAISADTAIGGDFDGDGISDLAIGSPHAAPLGRIDAGILQVLFGQIGGWPAQRIDLATLESRGDIRSTDILAANGRSDTDGGDVLGYSIAAVDVDRDGRTDIAVNEMLGNGVAPTAGDVGNLIILDGALVGTGVDLVECPLLPRSGCLSAERSALRLRRHQHGRRLGWQWRGSTSGDLGDPITGDTSYALCVYQSSPIRLALALRAVPQRACPQGDCWLPPQTALLRYRSRPPAPDGIRRARVRQRDATMRIGVTAYQWQTSAPTPPLASPVTVQLIAGEGMGSSCWEDSYDSPAANSSGRFLARTHIPE